MAAVAYIDKLDNFIALLEENPFMGIECKRKKIDKECQVLIYEEYLIFYRVLEKEVVILRILNRYYDYKDAIN